MKRDEIQSDVRKDLPRWSKPGWGELAKEGGREGWVLGAGPMNEPGTPSPTRLWDLDKCLEPSGSGFITCRESSLALTLGYIHLFHLLGLVLPFTQGLGFVGNFRKMLWGFHDIYQFQLSPALVSI